MDTQHIQSRIPIPQTPVAAVHTDDAARSFVAAFKQAIEVAMVPKNQKKEGERDQKKRGRHFTKEDYTYEDEVDYILGEIESRLNKLVLLAQQCE